MRLMSLQLAPPAVVMSRKPPAAPTAMRFRSVGLTPRLYELERKRLASGRPGEVGAVADAIRVHDKPPLAVRHTRDVEKWKKTRPVASRFAFAGMIAGKKPKPAGPRNPLAAEAPRWWRGGGLLPRFVRRLERCPLPIPLSVFAWH